MKKEFLNKEDVMDLVVGAIASKFKERIEGYSSPVNNIVDAVISEQADEIREICRDTLKTVVNDKEFKKGIKTEFKRKIAKSMVGKLEGSVEKAVEILRQNPQMRAEMILAIEKIIKDND